MPPRVPSVLALRALRAQISSPLPACSYCEASSALQESNGSYSTSGRSLLARNGSIPARLGRRTLSHVAGPARRMLPYAATPARRMLPYAATPARRTLPYAATPARRTLPYAATPARRQLSHVVPVTSVNATRRVPTPFKELYGALKDLEQMSVNYTNQTQLELALRGLESEDPTIRVAVLSLDSQDAAKRLVRVLLADPLASEQEWEQALSRAETDEKAVLVRHGEEFGVSNRNPVLRTIDIPSTFLRNHRLEILLHRADAVAGMSTSDTNAAQQTEYLLNLDLGTSAPAGGRSAPLLYPVHRTLVFANGLGGAQEIFRLVQANDLQADDIIQAAVNVPWQDAAAETALLNLTLVNVPEAEAAVAAFRQSLDNAFKYEHGWLNSNVATLLSVLSRGTVAENDALKPVLHEYVELVLHRAETAIWQEETERLSALAAATLSPATRTDLLRALTAWAEFAHTELRDELATALQSRTWRKIAWWKLLWRVDDIGLVMSDVLQRSYLLNAERYLLWLGGYFRAAGVQLADHPGAVSSMTASTPSTDPDLSPKPRFADPTQDQVLSMVRDDLNAAISPPETPPSAASTALNAPDDAVPIPPLTPASPWPQQLASSRNFLLGTIPPLQAKAQGLVLRTVATTGLSSAIGALAYANVSDTSVAGAGAIAAFGAAWALGAAQKQWLRAQEDWVMGVREEGKRVLESCERRGREVVEAKVRRGEESMESGGEGADERELARDGIARAREALAKLQTESTV